MTAPPITTVRDSPVPTTERPQPPTSLRMRHPAGRSAPEKGRQHSSRRARRGLRRLGRVLQRWACRGAVLAAVVALDAAGRHLGIDSIPVVAVAVVLGALLILLRRRPARRILLLRRVPAVALLGVLAATTWSYTGSLEAPGAAPISVRTSDWMRDHHMSSIVDRLEQTFYAGRAPGNGKVAPDQLPSRSMARPGGGAVGHLVPAPVPASDLLAHGIRGEGQWTPSGRLVGGQAVTYTTFVRPDAAHTDVVAAAVWLDPTATRLTYVPGTEQPGTWAWGAGIPASQRPNLVGAFNGGFRFRDHPGGYRTEDCTPIPLVDGKASLVIHRDGPAEIGRWGTQVAMTPDTVTVRQNLELIVDQGRSVPGLRSGSTSDAWGHRKWQLQYTNRSGIGITKDHALIFVAGTNLTTRSLADALTDLGAVRAMQLDIHATNPTFNFFDGAPGSEQVTGSSLTPSMKRPSDRFLAPDQRDFFAVSAIGSVGR